MNSRLKKVYTFVSIQFFTFALLFVLINIIAFLLMGKKDDREKSVEEVRSRIRQILSIEAYTNPELTLKEDTLYVNKALDDFLDYTYRFQREYSYYPRQEFIQASFESSFINVKASEKDINNRVTLTPIDSIKCIYCFGGSTTFGTMVADRHTWPALLMQHMGKDSIWVKNYGVSGYTVTQETDAFINLLKSGHRPSLAIFMDGVNTGPIFDGSEFAKGISRRFDYKGEKYTWGKIIAQLPIVHFLKSDDPNMFESYGDSGPDIFPVYESDQYNTMLASRFIENCRIRQAIGKLYGVKVIQILQPNVFVDYEYAFLNEVQKKDLLPITRSNYQAIHRLVMDSKVGYVDFTPLFKEYKYPAVVDGLHYSPDFNRFLAEKVSELFKTEELPLYRFEKDSATGIPFAF